MITRDPQTNCPDSFEGIDRIFTADYFLTPGECNPEQRMPLTLLINRLIEVATLHANQIGIGYAFLVRESQTWVLSRVAVEMKRYPGVNENYSISTWICSVSRLFSERDFQIKGEGGEVIGHARTVWAVINTDTRQVGDISRIGWVKAIIPECECPVDKPSRPRPVLRPAEADEVLPGYRESKYRFQYTDIDFNRHVNSSRYIELLLNQWSLDFHDANRLIRFEIAYVHEAHYDMEATLLLQADGHETRAELISHDNQPIFRALLRFSPR